MIGTSYLWAFVIGGLLCVAAQLVMDLTRLTPAHVMVLFVCVGAVLSGLGLYAPLVALGGAGATVPLPGFGHSLVQGIVKEVARKGLLFGLFSGGLSATAIGISAAVIFGYLMALLFDSRGKR
jgi:stage V sporulation protein AE